MTTAHSAAGTGPGQPADRLRAEQVSLGYAAADVITELSLRIPDDRFTVIVGPNACGKSTLLRALARLLPARGGSILLDGKDIHSLPAKQVARVLGLLPQTSTAPEGIRVRELVARGRYPYQRLWSSWTDADEAAVAEAMAATEITELADRLVEELSGGQRQRVWIALVLAQQTPLVLLDEPTTFLDVGHQYALLNLCRDLQRRHGRTVVAVLHDLNQACRYADHLVVMDAGRIVAEGAPATVITPELVERTFELPCRVVPDPVTGSPMVVPELK
ncbi:ABC transporter ATP-binding protein [Nakamurella aerolata]|uniref:ABC transporter ATP-binding protein n=1 Tax=Nakamurella aerolata TaxID=1656892 RepID=A0A849ACD8_9ACTN|nr:ABC transporter ATP-binding protein [Nakamurella aerolata]NNG36831.1 ABC transporter ATP-binding protein [Nakamurella aerolata]